MSIPLSSQELFIPILRLPRFTTMTRRNYGTDSLPFYENTYQYPEDWEYEELGETNSYYCERDSCDCERGTTRSPAPTLIADDDRNDVNNDKETTFSFRYNPYANKKEAPLTMIHSCLPLRVTYRNKDRTWVLDLGTAFPVILALEGVVAMGLFLFWVRNR